MEVVVFRTGCPVLAVLSALLAAPASRGDSFAIDLKVQGGKASQVVHAQPARGAKPKTRAVFKVKAGGRITVHWTLTRTDPKVAVKNVLVHFFVDREAKTGQRAVPRLVKGVVLESALTMDFNPKDKTQGEFQFTIRQSGSYLVRLETIGATAKDGREHFAALDLEVRH
jgi:hypothetical protein